MNKISEDFLVQNLTFPRFGAPTEVQTLYFLDTSKKTRLTSGAIPQGMELTRGQRVSFQTYFNAFPASYWRRWSKISTILLKVTVSGAAHIEVFRSKYDGAKIAVARNESGKTKKTSATETVTFELDLTPFEDGGWLWFEVTAQTDCKIIAAGWYAAAKELTKLGFSNTDLQLDNQLALGIPTFNRPNDAVNALQVIIDNPHINKLVAKILMPDQGTNLVTEHPNFPKVAAKLADKLAMFKQGNLGGSGGYSRIMYEALRQTKAPFILFMDDDVVIEADSIYRILAFSKLTKTPMLVGGQMLNLQEPSHLHTMGEIVDRSIFMWTKAPFAHYDHDFAKYPLSTRKKKHSVQRRVDVDYNGWWMCLIPRQVAEEIGQPVPLFIKWDDAEYGLRAGEHGYPTVTMPGIAIWHMAWSDKDDAIDWQAYFHLRNRLVVAALHATGSHKGLVLSSLKALVKHLICLEYSTVAIQIEALKDFLEGPDKLFPLLPTALPKVLAMRKQYSDAVVIPSAAVLPPSTKTKTSLGSKAPKTIFKKSLALSKVLVHNLRAENREHWEVPQANYTPIEARWFSLGQVDGATVTTADGRGVVYRKRDRELAKNLLKESLGLHKQLWESFPRLQHAYQAKLAELTDLKTWENVFKQEK